MVKKLYAILKKEKTFYFTNGKGAQCIETPSIHNKSFSEKKKALQEAKDLLKCWCNDFADKKVMEMSNGYTVSAMSYRPNGRAHKSVSFSVEEIIED